jgi:hypothetical protein
MKKLRKFLACFICVVIFINVVPIPAFAATVRDTSFETTLAAGLKNLGLFKGVSDTDFDLNREPTRPEAITILIRVLGMEKEAQSGTWKQPFTDVEAWADKYVGYAYEKGLTSGVSAAEYGGVAASANMFLTFMLRALGYSDTNGADFTWENPFILAKSIGILPNYVDTGTFLRADAVIISYAAMSAKLKGSSQTLAQKLISDGVFTQEQFITYYNSDAIDKHRAKTELSAKDIYAQCSPAVFYIVVYDAGGTATATGSGFFIDAGGTAVTNYHVIKGASSAKITVSNTGKVYDVLGVYACSEAEDWAVLKIDGTGFSYLDRGDTADIAGGNTIYAIGSPLGLQNTISQGLISNPARTEGGLTYIQISAPISAGSSGGALINTYGQVIGITSASYINGQNLNMALPISYVKATSLTSYTTLAKLFEKKTVSDPFAALVAYLIKNGTYYSDTGEYDIEYSTSTTSYFLAYYPDEKDIMLFSYYVSPSGSTKDAVFTCSVSFINVGQRYLFACSAQDMGMKASGYLTAKTFCSSSDLTITDYKGLSSAKSIYSKICVTEICDLLYATEYILDKEKVGITIKDLGFDAAYSEYIS